MGETVPLSAPSRGWHTRLRVSFWDLLSLRRLSARRRLRAERREADDAILRSDRVSPLLAWRVNELVSRQNRSALARSLRYAVKISDAGCLPSASPINRAAVRLESKRLLGVATLLDSEGSLAPRGVVLIERLLLDGLGPLYSRAHADALPIYLDVARSELEGDV